MTHSSAQLPLQDIADFRAAAPISTCVYCLETIKPGASVCPHCGEVLAPFERLQVDLSQVEARLAAIEQEVTVLRSTPSADTDAGGTASVTAPTQPQAAIVGWPHMVDNLFLGLTALLAAHRLATTLPHANRTDFRVAALTIAMPFGFCFEAYARTGTSGQVVVALSLGSLGTPAVGILDITLAGGMPASIGVQDIAASVAVIMLSHLAGSFFASFRRGHAEPDGTEIAAAQGSNAPLKLAAAVAAIRRVKPDRITSQAAAVKAVTDAAAALTATTATFWAAFGHLLF
jgi:hypothetical protein